MLGLFKSKKINIISPVTGDLVSVCDVPDEIFSDKIIGDGISVLPVNGEVFSPVDGEIVQIANAKHAIGIFSEEGLEILIHIGIDTVSLNGKGFEILVKEGQKVKIGQLIAKFDLKLLEEEGYPSHVIVLVTNVNILKDIEYKFGKAKAGETEILTCYKKYKST